MTLQTNKKNTLSSCTVLSELKLKSTGIRWENDVESKAAFDTVANVDAVLVDDL